jgi:hypothetical protein
MSHAGGSESRAIKASRIDCNAGWEKLVSDGALDGDACNFSARTANLCSAAFSLELPLLAQARSFTHWSPKENCWPVTAR